MAAECPNETLPKSPITETCSNCGVNGHNAGGCFFASGPVEDDGRVVERRKVRKQCYKCAHWGHEAVDCRNSSVEEQRQWKEEGKERRLVKRSTKRFNRGHGHEYEAFQRGSHVPTYLTSPSSQPYGRGSWTSEDSSELGKAPIDSFNSFL